MATLKDIAKLTNLTVSTVSDILNDRPKARYSEATRKLVHDAAKEVGYARNRLAHGVMKGRSHMIGILVPDLSNPFYSTLLQRITPVLREADYSPLVQEVPPSAHPEGEAEALKALSEFRVDGIIAFSIHNASHEEFFAQQIKNGRPVVGMGMGLKASPKLSGLLNVGIDFEDGIVEACEHLVSRGHTKVAFIGNFPWDKRLGRRYELINENFERLGISGQPAQQISCPHSLSGAKESFATFLDNTPKADWPNALFALNDNLAIGSMRAAKDSGMRIPEDLAVIGFDNTPIGRTLPISLSSIGCRPRDIGGLLAKSMVEKLKNTEASRKDPQAHEIFKAEFHARETS